MHFNQKYDYQQIINCVKQGLSDIETSKIIGCSIMTVYNLRKKFGLRTGTDYRKGEEPELTQEQKEYLFGTLLGDGYLRPHRKNYTGGIDHCLKQKEFIEWKHEIFKNLVNNLKCKERKCSSCKSGKSISCRLVFKSNINLKFFYDMFYHPKKRIPIEYLEKYYTPKAMAVHFMDDGSKIGNSGYIIMTMGFLLEDIQKYQDFLFKNYRIKTSLDKKNNVMLNKENAKIFTEIIKEHIVTSMMYKIHQSWIIHGDSLNKAVLLVDIKSKKEIRFNSLKETAKFLNRSSGNLVRFIKNNLICDGYKIQYI